MARASWQLVIEWQPRRSAASIFAALRLARGSQRRFPMRHPERGMTLLEIMIVLAILALVMGLVIGPKIMSHYRHARLEIAAMTVHKLADEDYPVWAVAHPETACPRDVVALAGSRLADPWGSEYRLHCGTTAPPERAFGASSLGEDQQPATADDVLSWRE